MLNQLRIAQKLWLAVILFVVMLAVVVGFRATGSKRCRPRPTPWPRRCRPG